MRAAMVNLYDDRILQGDDVLRRIFGILAQKGYLRDYAAVLTGDHGQLLGEHGLFGHGHYTYGEVLHIPMVFFGSRPLPALAQADFANQIDIAPTLADMAGLEIPSSWQGQTLLRPRTNPWSYHYSFTEPLDWGSVVFDGKGRLLKYARLFAPGALASSERLTDLINDPNEENNLLHRAGPQFLRALRRQADEHLRMEEP
jgi:arylsulfatase A-like enzyme